MSRKPKSEIAAPSVASPFEALQAKGFDILFLSHAKSILTGEFPEALDEIGAVLNAIELPITEIIGSGGGETKFTQRMRKALSARGWKKHIFEIGKTIVCVRQTHVDRRWRSWLPISLQRQEWAASDAAAAPRCDWPCALAAD